MCICTGTSNKTNATIKFKVNYDKQWLEVIEIDLTHNHETDQQVLPPFSTKKIIDNNVS